MLHLFDGPVEAQRVRIAALLVRRPALAAPFLDDKTRDEWSRVIGAEAGELPKNVIPLSEFQQDATDRPWARVISQLKGSGGIVIDTVTGKWSAGSPLPKSSGESWVEGRARVAIGLLAGIEMVAAEQNLVAFMKRVEHAQTGKSVS